METAAKRDLQPPGDCNAELKGPGSHSHAAGDPCPKSSFYLDMINSVCRESLLFILFYPCVCFKGRGHTVLISHSTEGSRFIMSKSRLINRQSV